MQTRRILAEQAIAANKQAAAEMAELIKQKGD